MNADFLLLGWVAVLLSGCGESVPTTTSPPPPPPPPPPPGAYTAFVAEYWYSYTEESQLVGKIGVEAQANTQLPALPVTAFYDVVADPAVPHPDGSIASGRVLRYVGGPQLNTWPVVIEAKQAGTSGNDIRILSQFAGGSRRKWTIQDHPTAPTVIEVYDTLDRRNLTARLAGSALVQLAGPVNDKYITLPGGPGVVGQVNTHVLAGGTATTRARIQFSDNVSGRTAVHGIGFAGFGGARRHLWVRTFLRFSPNWKLHADVGGAGAGSHKLIFVRPTMGARADFTADGGLRGWAYTVGGGLTGGTVIEGPARLPYHNVVPLSPSFPWPDLYNDPNTPGTFKMFRAPGGPPGHPIGDGNGEWYEIIWELKAGVPSAPERIEMTQAMRQYTVGGVKNPQPWRFATEYKVASPGGVWAPWGRYEQGINRNRQWDEAMHMDWAFYELVDGDQFPNPWGLLGG